MTENEYLFVCYHCGNSAPQTSRLSHFREAIWDEFPLSADEETDPHREDMRFIYDTERYYVFTCGTCAGLNLLGGFDRDHSSKHPLSYSRLYPIGPGLPCPKHTLYQLRDPIPGSLRTTYADAWPLRLIAPGAFANQLRRALEFVCKDQEARGATLNAQLQDLAGRKVFPPELAETADLIRQIGNRASHADVREVDRWDAELLDELFRRLLEFVYIVPSQTARLREKLGSTPGDPDDTH